jgi:hypothetical protein
MVDFSTHPLLFEVRSFHEWQEVLLHKSHDIVCHNAANALPPERTPATVQVAFWNAVIDYLIQAAALSPNISNDKRKVLMEFCQQIESFVRAQWREDSALLAKCEAAWDNSATTSQQMMESRQTFFENGLLNYWGQIL